MKKLIALITIINLLLNPAHAIEAGKYAIEHHTSREEISYNLDMNTEFKTAFLAALNTGNVVKVVHKVKIRSVDQWVGWLTEKRYTKYYKYNTINNQYYIGTKEDSLKPVASQEQLLENVTVLKNAPFLPKNVLQKGTAYEIDFTITINPIDEDSFGAKLLLFKGDGLKERIHSAVIYLDK